MTMQEKHAWLWQMRRAGRGAERCGNHGMNGRHHFLCPPSFDLTILVSLKTWALCDPCAIPEFKEIYCMQYGPLKKIKLLPL